MIEYVATQGANAEQINACVDAVLTEATLIEKVTMMSGQGGFAAFNKAGLWFTDGPRGVAHGESTCFPYSMARDASFDADLELRIGEAMVHL